MLSPIEFIILNFSQKFFRTISNFLFENEYLPEQKRMETSHKVEIFRYESHQLTNDPIQDSDFTIFISLYSGKGLPRICKFAWTAQQRNIIKVFTKF